MKKSVDNQKKSERKCWLRQAIKWNGIVDHKIASGFVPSTQKTDEGYIVPSLIGILLSWRRKGGHDLYCDGSGKRHAGLPVPKGAIVNFT
jgi:hypothetical protein